MDSPRDELLRLIRQHRLDERDARWATVALAIELGLISDYIAKAYLLQIEDWIREAEERPNLLPPGPDAEQLYRDGPFDIEIGTLAGSENLRAGIRIFDNPHHLLVTGSTGFGKTVYLRNYCVSLYRACRRSGRRLVIIVFCRKGGDFVDLVALGPDWRLLGVHDGLRQGLNGPVGMPVHVWANIVSTCIAARGGLRFGTTTLARLIVWLYEVLNADHPDPPLWPDMQLILDVARVVPPAVFASKDAYLESVIQVLDGFTQAGGNMLMTFNGLDIERDLIGPGLNAVIDISNLSPPALRLLFEDLLIARVLYGRIHHHRKTDATEIVFVGDEADPDISRQSEAAYPDGLSPLTHWLKASREFGGATLIGATMIGEASRTVLANVQTHIVLNQQDPASIVEAARSLRLPRGAEELLPSMKKGEAIVKSAHGWTKPMLCQLDHYPPHRGPRPDHYDTHAFVPSKRLDELPPVRAALSQLIAESRNRNLKQSKQNKAAPKPEPSLSANARTLLDLASLHPAVPVLELWGKTEKTPAAPTRSKVRKELEGKNLAEFAEARVGKKTWLLIEPTPEGYQELNKPPQTLRGRGKLVHRTFCSWLAQVGKRRGHHVVLEWQVPPQAVHPVDCAWKDADGRWHAFEVVVESHDNVASHLRQCLAESTVIADVTIVAGEAKALAKLRAALEADADIAPLLGRVRFELIGPYAQELGYGDR